MSRLSRVLIVALVVLMGAFGFVVHNSQQANNNFADQITANCETTNDNLRKFDDVLEHLAQVSLDNRTRTAAENREAAEFYRSVQLPVTTCPRR